MVLAAAALFPIMFIAAFAIDIPHWWDYSRNLQNRADAAALAAGASFGNICIEGSGNPGNVVTGAQSAIGKYSQLYTGAGVGEPAGRLPYTDAQVASATGWNVTQNGYLNNTSATSALKSPLTLRLGSLNDYWVIMNGQNYAENGGTNFSMNAAGSGATFCNSDPKWDMTDPDRATAGAAGPMLDVKVSQRHLPLFFQNLPGFGSLHPTIHAHARVALQGEASSPSEPIAVADTGYTPCVTVYFKNAADNSVLGTAVLTKRPQVNQTDPIIWDNAAVQLDSNGNPIPSTGPTAVQIPASANVYIQPYLNTCNGSGQTFDDATNSGVLLINSYGNSTPTSGQPPVITTGGVTLNNGSCAPDYFFAVATGGCNIQVTAHVAFAVAKNKASVTAVDTSDPTNNLQLNPDATGTVWTPSGNNHLVIGDTSGQHPIRIDWKQTDGTVGAQTCTPSNPCSGTFGVQAQSFGACNGCDQPDDSGPIILARVATSAAGPGAFGPNAYAQNSTQNLVVTLQLAGLNAAPATATAADDVVIRYSTSTNHQTGLTDCGQGNNGALQQYVIYGGCGPSNPFIGTKLPTMNPLFVYSRPPGSNCSPATDGNTTGWPSGNNQDCVATIPGQRTVNIVCPLVLRITGEPITASCTNGQTNPADCSTTNGASPCCPTNAWPNVPGGDRRAMTMIITSATDLNADPTAPQLWVPIRRFATFYITGWDTGIGPQCSGNDAYPGKGKLANPSAQNGSVWGHWINYTDVAGISNGQSCPTNSLQPINCVPALTR
jgi:hypothetical protein